MPPMIEKGSETRIPVCINFARMMITAAHTVVHTAMSAMVTSVPITRKSTVLRI